MAYIQTSWNKGDVITSAKLNQMEHALFAATNAVSALVGEEYTDGSNGTKTYEDVMLKLTKDATIIGKLTLANSETVLPGLVIQAYKKTSATTQPSVSLWYNATEATGIPANSLVVGTEVGKLGALLTAQQLEVGDGGIHCSQNLVVEGNTTAKGNVILGTNGGSNAHSIYGNLTINGSDISITASTLSILANTTIGNTGEGNSKNLTVYGATTTNTLSVGSTASITGAATLDNALTVAGAATLKSTLEVAGASVFKGAVTVPALAASSANTAAANKGYVDAIDSARKTYIDTEIATISDAISALSITKANLAGATFTGEVMVPDLDAESADACAVNKLYVISQIEALRKELNGVAFSGNYNDLNDVPTSINDFEDTNEYIRFPDRPTENGTYVLQAVVDGSTMTYDWVLVPESTPEEGE